jgi:hypothetical protein
MHTAVKFSKKLEEISKDQGKGCGLPNKVPSELR